MTTADSIPSEEPEPQTTSQYETACHPHAACVPSGVLQLPNGLHSSSRGALQKSWPQRMKQYTTRSAANTPASSTAALERCRRLEHLYQTANLNPMQRKAVRSGAQGFNCWKACCGTI
eukprot:8276952-Pyramimonas_sp.AAC.1